MSDRARRRSNLERRLTNLREAQAHINSECEYLEREIAQLTLAEATTAPPADRTRRGRATVPVTPPPARAQPDLSIDSSFSRATGISAYPSLTVPPNFDRLPPFKKGDIVEITNERNGEFCKQGVVDKKTPSFIYFSSDINQFQRASQNLVRIHISEYDPRK